MKESNNKTHFISNDLKDFVLGVIVLLLFFVAYIGTQLLGMSNPAYNEPPSCNQVNSSDVQTGCINK